MNDTGIDKLINVPRPTVLRVSAEREGSGGKEAGSVDGSGGGNAGKSAVKKQSPSSLERTIQAVSQALGTWKYSEEINSDVLQSQVSMTRNEERLSHECSDMLRCC